MQGAHPSAFAPCFRSNNALVIDEDDVAELAPRDRYKHPVRVEARRCPAVEIGGAATSQPEHDMGKLVESDWCMDGDKQKFICAGHADRTAARRAEHSGIGEAFLASA